ncbi:MAG: hypothetical protein AAGC55_25210, partial [Myxococcota bacterium]
LAALDRALSLDPQLEYSMSRRMQYARRYRTAGGYDALSRSSDAERRPQRSAEAKAEPKAQPPAAPPVSPAGPRAATVRPRAATVRPRAASRGGRGIDIPAAHAQTVHAQEKSARAGSRRKRADSQSIGLQVARARSAGRQVSNHDADQGPSIGKHLALILDIENRDNRLSALRSLREQAPGNPAVLFHLAIESAISGAEDEARHLGVLLRKVDPERYGKLYRVAESYWPSDESARPTLARGSSDQLSHLAAAAQLEPEPANADHLPAHTEPEPASADHLPAYTEPAPVSPEYQQAQFKSAQQDEDRGMFDWAPTDMKTRSLEPRRLPVQPRAKRRSRPHSRRATNNVIAPLRLPMLTPVPAPAPSVAHPALAVPLRRLATPMHAGQFRAVSEIADEPDHETPFPEWLIAGPQLRPVPAAPAVPPASWATNSPPMVHHGASALAPQSPHQPLMPQRSPHQPPMPQRSPHRPIPVPAPAIAAAPPPLPVPGMQPPLPPRPVISGSPAPAEPAKSRWRTAGALAAGVA